MTQAKLRPWLIVLVVAAGALIPCTPTHVRAYSTLGDAGNAPQGTPPPAPQVASSLAEAQVPDPPRAARGTQPGDVQKVFVLQHVTSSYLSRLLRVFPAEISSVEPRDGGVSALAVSAKPAVLAAIEETIRRLDQPGTESSRAASSVELTGYLLKGLPEPQESELLPPQLEAVVAQLRLTFKYRSYRLVDTVVARARAGRGFKVDGVTEQRLFPLGPNYYELSVGQTLVEGETPRIVRLTRLVFSLDIPLPTGPPPRDNSLPIEFKYRSIGLKSDIDVHDGQYVVVGKSGFGFGDTDNALLLVLTAKVVD